MKDKLEVKIETIILGVEPVDFVAVNFDEVVDYYTDKVKKVYPFFNNQLKFESRDNTVVIYIEDKLK